MKFFKYKNAIKSACKPKLKPDDRPLMFSKSRIVGALFAGLLLLGSTNARLNAHDGDDHGDGKPNKDELTRVLIFSKTAWYRHPAIPELNSFLVQLGGKYGAQFDVSESPEDFSRLHLYQAVIFNSTTDIGNSLNEKQRKQIKDWYQAGGGIMALHAAAVHHNTCHGGPSSSGATSTATPISSRPSSSWTRKTRIIRL